jgi:3,4-dihydroxy-2-butanone 4-phosphate synthase
MSMLPSRLEELRLPPLLSSAGRNEDVKGTAYHLTLDANSKSHPVGTGISASDRSMCARLVANGAGADDFTRPGHVVPLRYTVGGTRERVGHTEAAVGEWELLYS